MGEVVTPAGETTTNNAIEKYLERWKINKDLETPNEEIADKVQGLFDLWLSEFDTLKVLNDNSQISPEMAAFCLYAFSCIYGQLPDGFELNVVLPSEKIQLLAEDPNCGKYCYEEEVISEDGLPSEKISYVKVGPNYTGSAADLNVGDESIFLNMRGSTVEGQQYAMLGFMRVYNEGNDNASFHEIDAVDPREVRAFEVIKINNS